MNAFSIVLCAKVGETFSFFVFVCLVFELSEYIFYFHACHCQAGGENQIFEKLLTPKLCVLTIL